MCPREKSLHVSLPTTEKCSVQHGASTLSIGHSMIITTHASNQPLKPAERKADLDSCYETSMGGAPPGGDGVTDTYRCQMKK